MKKIIYSLVIMIAVGSLFTSCIENVEPVGIQELRLAKADYLNALAELRAADAELQLANAAYRLAETRWMNAKADQEEINTKIKELYFQRDQAYTQYYIDSINLEIKNMEERQAADLARAKQERAEAEEALRVALAKIEAAAMRLTTDEAKLITDVIDAYKLKLEAYNTAAENVTIAKTALWNVNYSYVDSVDWLAIYTNAQARAISRYNWWVSYYQQFIDAKLNDKAAWDAELQQLQDSMDAANYSRNEITKDSVYYMINVFCEANKAYKAKVDAYVAANITSPGTKPTRGYAVLQNAKYAYTANVAVVSRFNAYVDNMLFNGSVKYASQEGKLWNRNKGAVNADSILLKTKVAAEKDT
ncbi:MAG: hypothetical protein PHP76_06155, partial [Bacteroidales bacterium]|nr:hypothetical protein [Bacteroidales bacterium]